MSDELKPCPFCGAKAQHLAVPAHEGDDNPNAGGEFIECQNPLCQASTALIFPLMESVAEKLAERWNRRAAAPEPPAPGVDAPSEAGGVSEGVVLPELSCAGAVPGTELVRYDAMTSRVVSPEWAAGWNKAITVIRDRLAAGMPAAQSTAAEDRYEQYVLTLIDQNPDIQKLGERLTRVLDEDEWNTVEPILLGIAQRLAALNPPASVGDGMLPDELVPYAKNWYELCEVAPHRERCVISGELAEAIIATLCRLNTAPPAITADALVRALRLDPSVLDTGPGFYFSVALKVCDLERAAASLSGAKPSPPAVPEGE